VALWPHLEAKLINAQRAIHQAGGRLITDFSFPEGASVSNGIDPQLYSLQYTSVDWVDCAAQSLGKGALLAKHDIKSAYHLILIYPDDHCLLGAHFIDVMLPFGLHFVPITFTAEADALELIIR